LHFYGTNALHQNGVAERAIQTVSNIARPMLLHAYVHLKYGAEADLWPKATNYTNYMYNNTLKNGLCPADIFFGCMMRHHHLKDFDVWGCPVFVFDPKLEQEQRLPRWEP